jgi:hypothetical protein
VKVWAPIRKRTAHDEPVSTEVEWLEETADTYEQARDAIRGRVPGGFIVLTWYADDENRQRMRGEQP